MRCHLNFSSGDMVMFTSGSYSDYTVEGMFVAIEPFNIKEEYLEFIKSGTEYSPEAFIAFLSARNIIDEVMHATIDLGRYKNEGPWLES